jgi:hypothetical protein
VTTSAADGQAAIVAATGPAAADEAPASSQL